MSRTPANPRFSRGATLRAVIEEADRRQDGLLPLDVAGVDHVFDDELDLFSALQLRWHTRLAGRIEHAYDDQPLDLEGAVIHAWHQAADENPGVRLILDRYTAAPADEAMATAIARSAAKEHVLLAVTSGNAAVSDGAAVAVGARIAERARTTYVPGATLPEPESPRTFMQRLRAALAA